MSERLAALQRILAVQEIIRQRAEFALGAAERRKGAAATDRDTLAAFAEGAGLRGELAQLATIQGRRLAVREGQAEADVARQLKASQKAQARHKLTDQIVDRVARDEQASADRRELQELIDDLAGRMMRPA